MEESQPVIVKKEQETFLQKTLRKCKADPFVPIGAATTLVFLVTGFRAFQRGEARSAQLLMRGRVLAQGATIMMMCTGVFFGLKPHDRPKTYEEKYDRKNT